MPRHGLNMRWDQRTRGAEPDISQQVSLLPTLKCLISQLVKGPSKLPLLQSCLGGAVRPSKRDVRQKIKQKLRFTGNQRGNPCQEVRKEG